MAEEVAADEVSADFARQWWKQLMGNACALLEDAAVLADFGSPGRSQALLMLAMEELAKAVWLFKASEWEWSKPLGLHGQPPRPADTVLLPRELTTRRLSHVQKLQAAEQFVSGLGGFWDPERRAEYYYPAALSDFADAALTRNLDKQAGFYVDRVGDQIRTPLSVPPVGIPGLVRRAARALEMHLIEDHTRQQDATVPTAIDSVQDLHWVVLRYASPELFPKNPQPPEPIS